MVSSLRNNAMNMMIRNFFLDLDTVSCLNIIDILTLYILLFTSRNRVATYVTLEGNDLQFFVI